VNELSAAYHEAESRYQKAKNLQEAEGLIEQLKGELAWAHIAQKEHALSEAIVKTTRAAEKETQIQELVSTAQNKVAEAEAKMNEVQTRAAQAAKPEELQQQLTNLNQEINVAKAELLTAKVR
jgi:structural maintenance of chromosomes protein 6